MLSIRRVKTGSGAIAIQVVLYQGHRAKIIKHIGSGRSPQEVEALLQSARDYISQQTRQKTMFSEQDSPILIVNRAECTGVTHHFARNFLLACAKECGLQRLPALLLDLSMMRLLEPASKLRTIELLGQYFGITYSQRIYRNIPKLLSHKTHIEHIAFRCVTETLSEQCYIILYDVTTLYFETHKEDELRVKGFSKDDKSKQPQIVICLLTSISGFPLAHEVFPGNTFEGKTMLPLLERFVKVHRVAAPVIVADAAMLSEKNIKEMEGKSISYIVGARIANTSKKFIKRVSEILPNKDGATIRLPSKHGDMICSFSSARYRKQYREMQQQIEKAQQVIEKQLSEKRVKFVRQVSSSTITLNEELIFKTKLLLGVKGYCTNIPEKVLSNTEIIERYHDLWRIEQAFRMSKSDLQSRPIFHRKKEAIRSHVLICFVALMMEKYLELTTSLSLRNIKDLIWNITETHIQDTLTQKIFTFRSSTESVMKSPLGALIKQWNLPH